jgi:hypothetical protein
MRPEGPEHSLEQRFACDGSHASQFCVRVASEVSYECAAFAKARSVELGGAGRIREMWPFLTPWRWFPSGGQP